MGDNVVLDNETEKLRIHSGIVTSILLLIIMPPAWLTDEVLSVERILELYNKIWARNYKVIDMAELQAILSETCRLSYEYQGERGKITGVKPVRK